MVTDPLAWTLRQFIEHASWIADKIFKKDGGLDPIFHFLDRDGREFIMPAPVRNRAEKDELAATVRTICTELGVTRYLYVSEAWTVDGLGDDAYRDMINQYASLKDVPGRREVVTFMASDEHEGGLLAYREIIRPHGRKPYLAALEFFGDDEPNAKFEGRMFGLLPHKSTASVH